MLSSNFRRVSILKNRINFSTSIVINRKISLNTKDLFNSIQITEKIKNKENAKPSNVPKPFEIQPPPLPKKDLEKLISDFRALKGKNDSGQTRTTLSPGVPVGPTKQTAMMSDDNTYDLSNGDVAAMDAMDDRESSGDAIPSSVLSIHRFHPGDLVGAGASLAIVLGREKGTMYTMNFLGEVQAQTPLNIRLHISNPFQSKNWLSTKFLYNHIDRFLKNSKLVEDFLPYSLQLVKNLEAESRSFSMKQAHRLSESWEKYFIKQQKSQITISEVLEDILQRQPTPIEMLGAYKFFREERLHYYLHPDQCNIVVFYPKDYIDRIKSVRHKLQTNDPSVMSFWDKAKKITTFSRSKFGKAYKTDLVQKSFKAYHPDANQPINADKSIQSESQLPQLNKDDIEFLKVVQDFIIVDKFGMSHNLVPLVSSLLKPIGHYHYFYAPIAAEFLRDMGVYHPYQNLNFLHPNFHLNKMDNNPHWGIQHFIKDTHPNNVWDLIQDDCHSIRKDFGDLPVYTVDSESAHEIDDGISIQYDDPQNRDMGGWLRVHIADPTVALNSLDHPMLREVLHQPSTAYFPDKVYPMLPKWLSYGQCSLGDTTKAYDFRYVMTFSCRFDKDGKFDWNQIEVGPGKVRNFVKISYNQVNKLMGQSKPTNTINVCFPSDNYQESKVNLEVGQYDSQVLKDFEFIKRLTKTHRNERDSKGALQTFFPKPEIHVQDGVISRSDIFSYETCSNIPNFDHFQHQPKIQLNHNIAFTPPDFLESSGIVAECMIVAGRVASQFCRRNNLPSLFVVQPSPDFASFSKVEKAIYDKIINNQHLPTSPDDFVFFRSLTAPATVSFKPEAHHLMGISDGYLRVTSPLRRFLDIVNHLQIKRHLLGQPLISPDELIRINDEITLRNYRLNLTKKVSDKFYTLELLKSIHHLSQKDPKFVLQRYGHVVKSITRDGELVMDAIVTKYDSTNDLYSIYLKDIGVFAHLEVNISRDGNSPVQLKFGEEIQVKLVQLIRDLNVVKFNLVQYNLD